MAALNTSDVDTTSAQPHGGATTSAAFFEESTPAGISDVLVVASNAGDSSLPNPSAGHWNQWAVSNNAGQSFFTQRSEANFPWQVPNGTLSDGNSPPSQVSMSDGSGWAGGVGGPTHAGPNTRGAGPSIVPTGGATLAWVSLAESQSSAAANDTPLDVLLATSVDGGQTFGPGSGGGQIFRVSDSQSSAADTGGGLVFEPTIAMESNAALTGWITLDNTNVPFNGGGKRPWIRKVTFDGQGGLHFGPITEVRIDCNLSCVKFDAQNVAARCLAPNADGTCPDGQDVVLMSFPRVNNSSVGTTALTDNQSQFACLDQNSNPVTFDVQWRAAISVDGGVTWTQGVGNSDGSVMMDEDPTWPNCIFPTTAAIDGNNRGRTPMLRDDGGGSWQIFYTKGVATSSGQHQRIFQAVFSDDQFTNLSTQEVSANTFDPNTGVGCGGECPSDQFLPAATISLGSNGNSVAAVWLDTRRDSNPTQKTKGAFWGAVSHQDGSFQTFTDMEVDQAGPLAPWASTGTNADTPWGDYVSITTDGDPSTPTFFPAWADTRCADPVSCSGGHDAHVWTRGWMPP